VTLLTRSRLRGDRATRRASSRAGGAAAAIAIWLSAGCGDEPGASAARGMDVGSSAKSAAPQAAASEVDTKLVLKDEDFLESERNRDPFRSYSLTPGAALGAEPVVDPQRPVVMPTTAVEEMKLIAVVLGLPRPKAMLTDGVGVGHVVQRGDYLGKAKMLQATGSVPMMLNWRVDRIRENEVVLTRQDPTDASNTPMSRIISMID
jgi:hypothetical protein